MRQSAPKCRFNVPKLDTFWTPTFEAMRTTGKPTLRTESSGSRDESAHLDIFREPTGMIEDAPMGGTDSPPPAVPSRARVAVMRRPRWTG
jgi:hypothetical protein